MPKLIPKKSSLGVAKNVDHLVRWILDHEQSIFKKNPKWTMFAEKLMGEKKYGTSYTLFMKKTWLSARDNNLKDKPYVGYIIAEILFQGTLLSSLTTTSVAPPSGEKNTPMVGVSGDLPITGRDGEMQARPKRKIKPTKRRGPNAFIRRRVTDGSG